MAEAKKKDEFADVVARGTKRIDAAEKAVREARDEAEKEKDEFVKAEREQSNKDQPELPDK